MRHELFIVVLGLLSSGKRRV